MISLASNSSVIAPLGNNRYFVKISKEVANKVHHKKRNNIPLLKKRGIYFPKLCWVVEKTFDHVPTKHDNYIIYWVIVALNLSNLDGFLGKLHNSLLHNLRVVRGSDLGALPICCVNESYLCFSLTLSKSWFRYWLDCSHRKGCIIGGLKN